MKPHHLSESDKIFCNGAFLQPCHVEINGIKQWRWVLVGAEDDSYLGGNRVDIYDYADSLQGLLAKSEES